jgi:hypothetical protein
MTLSPVSTVPFSVSETITQTIKKIAIPENTNLSCRKIFFCIATIKQIKNNQNSNRQYLYEKF